MSPLEAVARALAKHQRGTDDFDALEEALQEVLKDTVRVVLEALRVPSEDMSQASEAKRQKLEACGARADMIYAALKEA